MENSLEKLNYISKSLAVFGCFDSATKRNLYSIVVYGCTFIIFLGETIGFINHDTTQARIEILFNIFIFTFSTFYMNYGIRSQQDQLRQFLSDITQEQSNIFDDLRVKALSLTMNRVDVIAPKLMMMIFLNGIPAILGWCFTPLWNGISYQSKNFQFVPYLFQCTDEGKRSVLIKVLCSVGQTLDNLTFFSSIYTVFFLWCYTIFVLPLFFIVFIWIFVEANVTVIKEEVCLYDGYSRGTFHSDVQNNQEEANEKESVSREREKMEALKKRLSKIMLYHKYIYG